MREPRIFSHQEAKAFYNRLGKKQDWQGFYEDVAIEALIRSGEFDKAGTVLELGCGTGRFAERLLRRHLPGNARYVGIDISETMVASAKERLLPFGPRAKIFLTDGSLDLEFEPASFDRFVANYVLDLLSIEDVRRVIQEARRVLSGGGRMGLASLTNGFTPISRFVERTWTTLHAIRPALVGGCRPISLLEIVTGPGWRIQYDEKFIQYGVPSEVLVAEKSAIG